VAEHVSDKFRRRYPSIPDDHIHVIYNAADTDLFLPRPGCRPTGTVHISYHSLWEEPKGVFDLLAAVELLEQRRDDFRVHLAGSATFEGSGERQRQTQERVESWAARLKTVDLVGPLQHHQLAEHLRQMDIGVFPSSHEDPFPLAPIEMMASGIPVVAYDIGGVREAIEQGRSGLLVPSKDVRALATSIEALMGNSQLRLEIGAAARRRVERHFTWDRHAEGLLAIYEQIIKRNRDWRR